VVDSQSLPTIVAATPVDQQATVTVIRNGERLQFPVKIAELPSQRAENNQPVPAVQPAREKWGLQLRDLNPQIANQLRLKSDQGVVVVGVEPGSRAAASGVRQGDVILEVNRQSVSSMADMMAKLKDSKDKDQMLLLVQRQNGKLFIPLLENIG
jgi:serine protease Do